MLNNDTILEKAHKALAELKPDLAKGDIKECAKEVGITMGNVSLYMNSKGGSSATAVRILTYLRKVVNERKKAIA